jgi:hypothetical protein
MRKVTKEAAKAFIDGVKFNSPNTKVEVLPNVTVMYLFDNPIAYKYNDPEGTISITNCGWFTNTTKERLNAIPGVSIQQKNWDWYLNGNEWSGELVDVYPLGA